MGSVYAGRTHTMHNEERTPRMQAHAKCKKLFFHASSLYPPFSLFCLLPSHDTTRHDMEGWIGGLIMHQKCIMSVLVICRLSICLLFIPSLPLFFYTSLKSPHSQPTYTQINTPSTSQTHILAFSLSFSASLSLSLSLFPSSLLSLRETW